MQWLGIIRTFIQKTKPTIGGFEHCLHIGRCLPIWGGGPVAYLVHHFKCQSHLETSPQTHSEIMFSQVSGRPKAVRLTHKIN